MLKEKDKRIVLLVIFGVALVSLITAIVVCFVNSFEMLFYLQQIRYNGSVKWLATILGGVLLGLGCASVVYLCIKLFVRKTFVPSLIFAVIVVTYSIVSTIVLGAVDYFDVTASETHYSLFSADFVAVAVTLAITTAITEVSHLLVLRMDRKKAKETESQSEQLQGESAEQ